MPVVVSVADSATVWFEIEAEIAPRLPLKGVTWLQNGRTQRLIETLDIQFVPFRVDMFPRVVPGTATPFSVHLLLVNAEVFCYFYKSAVRVGILWIVSGHPPVLTNTFPTASTRD
ncbi:hypothetical protein BC830DRAFT_1174365 [Chytriomyces sp. MP71]|nr:hypothetical protein BC830DRAFT_1174365 [Chytriomyces sp. MP71]